jgi:hypothetical protein
VYAGQKAGVRGDALQQRDESSPAGFIECGEKFGVVTTVHMKDRTTGPQGFLPFVRSVLGGLESYEFRPTGPTNGAHVSS